MLLNVANAMHTDPQSGFYIQNTEVVPNAQPMYSDEQPAAGIVVMTTTLAIDTRDEWRNRVVPAGTVVVAPIQRITADRNYYGLDFVYAAHDDQTLRENSHAFFYDLEDLETLFDSEMSAYGALAVKYIFDPMTFGTGSVAELFHPRVAQTSDRMLRQQQFDRARGPDTLIKERVLTSHRLIDTPLGGPPPVPNQNTVVLLKQVFSNSRELQCIRARLVNTLAMLPRAAGKHFDAAAEPKFFAEGLPRGASRNACCEGQVVQSAAAWTIRTDPRLHVLLGGNSGAVKRDLPLILGTHATITDNVLAQSPPWLMRLAPGARRVGFVALGPAPMHLWTVHPLDVGVANELLDATGSSVAMPTMMEWQHPFSGRKSVDTWADVAAYIAQPGVRSGELSMIFGQRNLRLRLQYTECAPGYAALYDTANSGFQVSLPASAATLHKSMVLGLRLTSSAPDAELKTRVQSGHCPLVDDNGLPTGVSANAAEAIRVRNLLPDVLPYQTDPTHADYQRDARVQNLLYSVPHSVDDLSTKLRQTIGL